MSEKITKSWIEKTIHEKAKQRFEDDVVEQIGKRLWRINDESE